MRKINLDETTKQELIAKFTQYVQNLKLTKDTIHYSADLKPDTAIDAPKPTVFINAEAYLKMMLYVRDTDIEIAWHGTVERDIEHNWYHIKDVFLYPQIIRSTTVDTDQEKYNKWLEELDDETFNALRFQGHSHVNMGTSPSGTDIQMYDNFLQVLPRNDYYMFMILNKRGEFNFYIYDLAKNIIYETEDIDVRIITSETVDLIRDIKDSKNELCERPTYSYGGYKGYGFTSIYKDEEDYLMNRDMPYYDINNHLDDIDKKYKNVKLINVKKGKIKAKGGKK